MVWESLLSAVEICGTHEIMCCLNVQRYISHSQQSLSIALCNSRPSGIHNRFFQSVAHLLLIKSLVQGCNVISICSCWQQEPPPPHYLPLSKQQIKYLWEGVSQLTIGAHSIYDLVHQCTSLFKTTFLQIIQILFILFTEFVFLTFSLFYRTAFTRRLHHDVNSFCFDNDDHLYDQWQSRNKYRFARR